MSRAKVCQVFGFYGYGGIYRVAVELSLRIRKRFDVVLACRKILGKPEEDIEIVELAPKNTIDLWIKLQRLRNSFDIVHTHDVYSLPGLVVGRRKSKIVYTDHGIIPLKYHDNVLRSFPGVLFAHMCRIFALWTDVTVGISDYITTELRQIGCRNVITIPNGVDIDRFRPIGESEQIRALKIGDPMLLKVGLIERHKNIDYHISAMYYILKRFPRAALVFIGTGKDFEHYKNMIKKTKLKNSVHFLGWVPEHLLPLYYNAADVILQVDSWHGFGLPILEGMACGKPVIARNAYAMKEHIIKSGAGILVDGERPVEILKALEDILTDYEYYSLKARKYAEKYSWDGIAAKYIEIYEKLLRDTNST